MKKKPKRQEAGANWMDTYGDMVTLLLCFFVLLYSMSTISQEKWISLVRSFNPDATPSQTETSGNMGEIAEQSEGNQVSTEASVEQLYESLQNYVTQQNAQTDISVTKGDGYVFLSMNDTVFFKGDSPTLLDAGKRVLDDLAVMLGKASSSIDELRIMGHTAQGRNDQPNDADVDRTLSSNRSTNVLLYLQEKNVIPPDRLVSVSYGQWRPIADNSTKEGKQKNRRVEFIITGKNLESAMPDSIDQYYTMRGTSRPES